MRRAITGGAFALMAVLLALTPEVASAQYDAIPQTVFGAQAVTLSEAQLDSACAARALPLAGSALFGGLRDAIGRARLTPPSEPLPPAQATMRAVTMAGGWYLVLMFIGLAVLLFASDRLRQVTETLEQDTVGSLLTGLLASLASVPLLIAIIIGLAVTVIGILLIPFAAVAVVLLYAGLALLGFLAVSSVIGRAVLGDRKARMTERAVALSGLIVGLSILMSTWLATALFTWSATTELVLRSMALGLTAVAVTAGVGAVIRSFRSTSQQLKPPAIDELAWQTPTPVGGVVAVRRSAS
jgi:MFS family permease